MLNNLRKITLRYYLRLKLIQNNKLKIGEIKFSQPSTWIFLMSSLMQAPLLEIVEVYIVIKT